MDSAAAFVLVVVLVLPLAIGLVAGEPMGYWIWAALVGAMAVAQAFSGEVQAFVVMVVVLGGFGLLSVLAGTALRRQLVLALRRGRSRSSQRT